MVWISGKSGYSLARGFSFGKEIGDGGKTAASCLTPKCPEEQSIVSAYRRFVPAFLVASAIFLAAAAAPADNTPGDLGRKVDQVFAAYDKADSPGCALGVVRDGNFIYKRGYGAASLELGVPITPESVFYMGSVSKQFTAASVVLAAEQGFLSLDDDVRKHVPELPSYGKTITLREMLHHTSGLRDIFGLLSLSGRNAEDIHPTSELLDLIAHQKALNFNPGDEYLYSNSNYFLMSVIIRRTTGEPLSQFAEENIFKPLGMTHTRFYDDRTVVVPGRIPAYEPRQEGGFRVDWSTNFDKIGDGGLLSTVDDLLLWDRNFYDNKLGKGSLLKEMQTQGVLNNGHQIAYALGLGITKYRGLPVVGHGGALFGYRTAFLRFPQQKFSVMCLCNLGTANPDRLSHQVVDLYLEKQLSPEPAAGVPLQVDATPFAGAYRDPESHEVLLLIAREGYLVGNGLQLKPRDATHFVSPQGPELNFDRRPDGGIRLSLTFDGSSDSPQIFEKYDPLSPSAEDLAQYAGDFTSAELETTYHLAFKDNQLKLTVNWQEPVSLNPSVHDEFLGPSGSAMVFHRDAGGHITGLEVFAGRVRNIAFARASK
jgi:CubicO group peptidase (beta-lactamase class C family)